MKSVFWLTDTIFGGDCRTILRQVVCRALGEIRAVGALRHVYRSDWPRQLKHRYGLRFSHAGWASDVLKGKDVPEHLDKAAVLA